ncbi:ABC transporter ATP-binding protein [Cellulomonas xylanilytica]|uniref:ABC transporter ATP-binding protein n=1 Tax=Cellulomonas xylanilytica TaxID=233583 RepID=A0A510V7A1_9CELL|nr:ATP-binding cassette domain-containing protein [Cellulomonas xylanilytica]GEK22748.1 ABC transporter ATP-binding protein [Cellulomonas xylanilytica]
MTSSLSTEAPPTSGPALEVAGLTVTFPGTGRRAVGEVVALQDVDLRVRVGEFVAVVGPSGCGKSTLLRVLAGLTPTGGSVSGRAVVGAATAWMPQRDGLLPWRRALPNALVGARIAGLDRAVADARARALFDEFGLAGFERAWPHELSGGMRQRLALLRTCLPGRPVLLLDEPFGALDAITRRRMNAWLAGLDLAGHGRAVVLVTHDVDEALLLADRVVVLSDRPGRVVLDLPVPRDATDGARRTLLTALDPRGGA